MSSPDLDDKLFATDSSGPSRCALDLHGHDQGEPNPFTGGTESIWGEPVHIFQAVADCTYDWELWLDLDGKLVWVNNAVERLTGYSLDDCRAMAEYPLNVVVPEDMVLMRQILREASLGRSGNDQEFRIRRKDGEICWFAVSWQPLIYKGQRTGTRMSMRDIRERKAMEEERAKYSQELEELAEARAASIVTLKRKKLRVEKLAALGGMAAKVAHEINNPIAGMKNAIRLVRDDAGMEESSRRMLTLVDKEIDRVGKLLRQMYQLYKPSVADATEFRLKDVLEDVVAMVSAQCDPHQVDLVKVNWPVDCSVFLCEQEFRQILHNLLLNAWEASEPGAQVEIEVLKCDSSKFRVAIRDHGCGIPPDLMARIFEPFVTTKQDSKRSGSGLGLAIAQSLANALGGMIDLESTPGQGASFILELPVDHAIKSLSATDS